MRSEKPDLSSINHIYCNVLRTVSSYSGSVQGSLYSRKERSNRAVHVCVLREFLYRKNSCRLQERNSTSENALAGCKRRIAQPKMPLQVARGKSLNRKCNNIVVIPRGLQSPHPLGSFAYVSLRNHGDIAIRRQLFTLCMVQIHRKRVRHSW